MAGLSNYFSLFLFYDAVTRLAYVFFENGGVWRNIVHDDGTWEGYFVGMCAILLDLQMVMDNIVCTFFAILNR